jgi:hypothetical protein
MICCHTTHNNEIFLILISDFSQEIYVLPDDDMQCGIETCRSSESVLNVYNFRLIHDIQLVHLLVYNTQWIFKMHGATIKIIDLYLLRILKYSYKINGCAGLKSPYIGQRQRSVRFLVFHFFHGWCDVRTYLNFYVPILILGKWKIWGYRSISSKNFRILRCDVVYVGILYIH